jgi:hypothetical protein
MLPPRRERDEQGRFVEGWGNWDGIALLRQLGALPTHGS